MKSLTPYRLPTKCTGASIDHRFITTGHPMAEQGDLIVSEDGSGLRATRVLCRSCGDAVVADVDGRCPECLLGVDGSIAALPRNRPVQASPQNGPVQAPPRKRRDGVDTFGEVLLVVKGSMAIIALAYLVASCG
jgi:hypothetical protein